MPELGDRRKQELNKDRGMLRRTLPFPYNNSRITHDIRIITEDPARAKNAFLRISLPLGLGAVMSRWGSPPNSAAGIYVFLGNVCFLMRLDKDAWANSVGVPPPHPDSGEALFICFLEIDFEFSFNTLDVLGSKKKII